MTDYEKILAIEFDSVDIGHTTIKDYLKELLKNLWLNQEGFSGKRPFGNSGWPYDLYFPLVQHGFIKGLIEDDCLEDLDQKSADKLVTELIEAL